MHKQSLQTEKENRKGLGVDPPCCIPIELDHLSMLTIIKHNITVPSKPDLMTQINMDQTPAPPVQKEEERTVLSQYDNMIVTKCGCR